MTTFSFTENEAAAVKALFKSCLDNMGGECYEDLANDPFTWVDAGDLIAKGWTRHEAAGTLGALLDKGAVDDTGEGLALSMKAAKWADETK